MRPRHQRRLLAAEQHHRPRRDATRTSRSTWSAAGTTRGPATRRPTIEALSRTIKGPVYLIMGPWIHGQQGGISHGQVSFGPTAAIADPLAWRLRVVRPLAQGHRQRGRQAGAVRHAGADLRDGHWRRPARPTRACSTTAATGATSASGRSRAPSRPPYYLHAAREAFGRQAVRRRRRPTSFRFDPAHPVPTIGGNISSGDGILLQGAWDQRGGPHVWNCAGADSAFGAQRRAGVPDPSRSPPTWK